MEKFFLSFGKDVGMQEDVKYVTINIILKVQICDNKSLNSFHIYNITLSFWQFCGFAGASIPILHIRK